MKKIIKLSAFNDFIFQLKQIVNKYNSEKNIPDVVFEIGEYLKAAGLERCIKVSFSDITFNILFSDFEINESDNVVVDAEVNNGSVFPQRRGMDVIVRFQNVSVRGENGKFLFDIFGTSITTLVIEDSSFVGVIFESRSAQYIRIKKSNFKTFIVSFHGEVLEIDSSYIEYLNFWDGCESVRITNSIIGEIEARWFLESFHTNLRFLLFDQNSLVLSKPYETYKKLRFISEKLNDKTQSHIFYTKELQAFSEDGDVDFDSKILIKSLKLFNGHGLSTLLPIIWIFVSNIVFVLIIYFLRNQQEVSYLWNFINISPLGHSVSEEDTVAAQSIDSLRKLIISIFYYLTIVSAVRFRYKK